MARSLGTRSRFLIAYLLLGAAVGAALGAFVVLLERPAPKPPPAWSSWRPGSSSLDLRAAEIAEHVGTRYRLPTGNRLTNVTIGHPGGQNLRSIAIPTVAQPKTLADVKLYDRKSSLIYVLCGSGQHCNLEDSVSRTASGTALRREALELALYAMEYIHPIDDVLVFFPPAPGKKTVSATLFFRRSDLESRLKNPLRKTLPQAVPPLPGKIRPVERKTVDELTRSSFYVYVGTVPVKGYGSIVQLQPPSS